MTGKEKKKTISGLFRYGKIEGVGDVGLGREVHKAVKDALA